MKKILLIFLAICLIFTTGCWDMIEIEDRLLPYSISIDLNKEESEKQHGGDKTFFICFAYPNINALGKSPTQDNLANLVNSNSNSIFDAMDEISSRVYSPVFLKHLNVLILSEEVAANEKYVMGILDGLKRNFLINKKVFLLVTKENAHKLVEKKLESKRQETVEGMFVKLLQNEQRSTQFTPIALKEFITNTDNKKVSIVPLAIPGPEIEFSGGGLFKDYKFIGNITGDDNRNITILNNKSNRENIDMQYNEVNISARLDEIKSKKKLIIGEDTLKIQYDVKMDAEIHQYIIDPKVKIDSQETMNDIGNKISEIIEADFADSIEKLQSEFNADALGILEYIYKFHPKIYKEVKDDWDSIFPHLDIDVNIEVIIRRRGLSNY